MRGCSNGAEVTSSPRSSAPSNGARSLNKSWCALFALMRSVRSRKKRIILVTTLLDPLTYPAKNLVALYARRWHLELALRHLKTTMGMELLRCQTPEMAEKELLAYLVAYNLIRCLMAEAVALAGAEMERLSFKGSVDAVRQYSSEIRNQRGQKRRRELWSQLLGAIARDQVPLRPHRNEPRAVKRRPKPYQLLN